MANGSACILCCLLALLNNVFSNGMDRRPTVCNLPIETGLCDGTIYRYSYEVEQSACIKYVHRGCGGNANQFDTMSECRKTCETNKDIELNRRPTQCNLPIENFYCDGTVRKYAFDTKTSECKRFVYEGCGGNANQFDTMSECRKTCEVSTGGRPQQCNLPIVRSGSCVGNRSPNDGAENRGTTQTISVAILRYAFEVKESQCVRFTHLGCHGNANQFETLQECRKTCEVNF